MHIQFVCNNIHNLRDSRRVAPSAQCTHCYRHSDDADRRRDDRAAVAAGGDAAAPDAAADGVGDATADAAAVGEVAVDDDDAAAEDAAAADDGDCDGVDYDAAPDADAAAVAANGTAADVAAAAATEVDCDRRTDSNVPANYVDYFHRRHLRGDSADAAAFVVDCCCVVGDAPAVADGTGLPAVANEAAVADELRFDRPALDAAAVAAVVDMIDG